MGDTVTVESGDKIVLERNHNIGGLPAKLNARLFRGDKDIGIVATIEQDGVLIVKEGKTPAEKVLIEVPPTIGLERTDQVPRFEIKTKNPVQINGGDFILMSGKAHVIAKPQDAVRYDLDTGKPKNEPTLNDGTDDNNSNRRRPKNSVSFTYANSDLPDAHDRTVTVAPGNAEITVIDMDDKAAGTLIKISGKGLKDAKKNYDALVAKVPAPGKEGEVTPSKEPDKKNLSHNERKAVLESVGELREGIAQLKSSVAFEEFFKNNPQMSGMLDNIKTQADKLMAKNGSVIDPDQLNRLHDAMYSAVNTSANLRYPNDDPMFTQKLEELRSGINNNPNLSIKLLPQEAVGKIDELSRGPAMQQFAQKNPAEAKTINTALDEAKALLPGLITDGKVTDKKKLDAFNAAIDAAVGAIGDKDPELGKKIKAIRDQVTENPATKISMNPAGMDNQAYAAATQAAKGLLSHTSLAVLDTKSNGAPLATEVLTGKTLQV